MPIDDAASRRRSLDAVAAVLASAQAARNGRALGLLLAGFAVAGLLLSAGPLAGTWSVPRLIGAFVAAFYGANAAGLLLMDEACARLPREPRAAMRDALSSGHRLLAVAAIVLVLAVALVAAVAAVLGLGRLPVIGPAWLGLAVPAGVLLLGGAALALVAVIGPLAAPAVWSGLSVRATLAFLARQVRERLLDVALLMGAVSLLAAAVATLLTFVVVSGGRAVSVLLALTLNLELPPNRLLAALLGRGVQAAAMGPADAQVGAALIGAGVVFMLALALPALVYLRGACAVYRVVARRDASP